MQQIPFVGVCFYAEAITMRLFAIPLLGLLFVSGAHAQSIYDRDWACWYQGAGKLNCLLLKASALTQDPALDPTPTASPLPDEVHQILAGSEALQSSLVEIPLMSDPEDMLLVEQLARVSVCGDTSDCRMTFVSTEQELALLQESIVSQP